jgi:hypothetical protein
MDSEKARYKMYKAKQIFQVITISKAGQVHYFQLRLPRHAIQVAALEYDITLLGGSNGATEAVGGTGATGGTDGTGGMNGTDGTGGTDGTSGTEPSLPLKPINFNWQNKPSLLLGQLKLQSMEQARQVYTEWIRSFTWNNGLQPQGVFPLEPNAGLVKSKPQRLTVPAKSTVLKGIYQDQYLATTARGLAYRLKICVWVFVNEPSTSLKYECLDYSRLELIPLAPSLPNPLPTKNTK